MCINIRPVKLQWLSLHLPGSLSLYSSSVLNINEFLFFFLCCQDAQCSEDREMLARQAASAENPKSADSQVAIEKYLRSVLAVENILTLDRLRQVWTHTHTHTHTC